LLKAVAMSRQVGEFMNGGANQARKSDNMCGYAFCGYRASSSANSSASGVAHCDESLWGWWS
jgi:hypothetical protein